MKDARTQFREQNKAFFETSRANMKAYHEAKEANDTAKVTALKPTIDAQRKQMDTLRKAEHERMVSFLTPTQKTQLEQMKKDHTAKMEKRDGERDGEGHERHDDDDRR
jgi:Spy/CpxP family protein refolding chaperone